MAVAGVPIILVPGYVRHLPSIIISPAFAQLSEPPAILAAFNGAGNDHDAAYSILRRVVLDCIECRESRAKNFPQKMGWGLPRSAQP
jgi:hypothetical protein